MRDRPIYIGLLCWYLIIWNTWCLVHAFFRIHNADIQAHMQAIHLPMQVQVAKYFLSFFIPLVCGIFMSEGANWARVAYIAWGLANYTMEAIFVPDKGDVILGVGIFSFCAFILLLPAPRGWFLLPQHFS